MALRISRRVCTLGRPGALGAGTKGSMWNHSASDKSVWYALLMLGTLPSHYLTAGCTVIDPCVSVCCMSLAGKSCASVDEPVSGWFNFTATRYQNTFSDSF